MADENTEVVETEGSSSDEGTNDEVITDDPTAEKRRQNAVKRARKAETEAKQTRAQLSEQATTIETLEEKIAELSGVKEGVDTRLERKDKKIADLSAKVEELEGLETQRQHKSRFGTFAERVAQEAGLSKVVASGLMRELQTQDADFDLAPEEFGKLDVRNAVRSLKELEPSLFEPKTGGKARKMPGPASKDSTSGLDSKEQAHDGDLAAYWSNFAANMNKR